AGWIPGARHHRVSGDREPRGEHRCAAERPQLPAAAYPRRLAEMADGVYYLTGTSHHSLAIEMSDYIVVVDTPLTQARGEAVLAKAKELIPGKPIRYVITSHHHWDHLGGIRAAMDEGATILTHQSNKALLE